MSKITPQRSSARSIGAKKPSFSAVLVLAVMLFNVMVPIVSAKSTLVSGEQLRNGEYLESPDRSKHFVVKDGQVIIQEKGKRDLWRWPLIPDGDQGSDPTQHSLGLDNYGLLSGIDGNGVVKHLIHPEMGKDGTWELSLRNNGLLYLKNPAGVIVWNNICGSIQTYLETTTVFVGGSCLVSPDYGTFLHMTKDGNLELYKGYTLVYHYAGLSHPGAHSSTFLVLDKTGGVYVKSYTIHRQYVVHKFKPPLKNDKYRLTITNDAKMRIVDSRGRQMALFRPKQL
ncbi:MAG: hypothetical protein J3Q66DRAFT_321008 [Benniella sp.]|nr:MAG: hypothetical protein J3Q66DRAFT_321008 [Benniella sp.]